MPSVQFCFTVLLIIFWLAFLCAHFACFKHFCHPILRMFCMCFFQALSCICAIFLKLFPSLQRNYKKIHSLLNRRDDLLMTVSVMYYKKYFCANIFQMKKDIAVSYVVPPWYIWKLVKNRYLAGLSEQVLRF